jgi:hypothetical protein
MRLEASAMSYKYIEADFEVTESEEDMRVFGHDRQWTYRFGKGEYVCIPHGVHQGDERYWGRDTGGFDPRRFWVKQDNDQETRDMMGDVRSRDKGTGTTTTTAPIDAKAKAKATSETKQDSNPSPSISYRTMKVWGGGREVCKGKKFAEGEVLLFAAAILHFWDMTPINVFGQETSWKHPGRKDAAGATKPKGNLRVRMRRRV